MSPPVFRIWGRLTTFLAKYFDNKSQYYFFILSTLMQFLYRNSPLRGPSAAPLDVTFVRNLGCPFNFPDRISIAGGAHCLPFAHSGDRARLSSSAMKRLIS